MQIRSSKYLKAAKDQPCIFCGSRDGTVVSAHYTGLRQHMFGKGRGIKCDDIFVADLCRKCHEDFDSYKRHGRKSIEHSEEFMFAILMTIRKRIQQGFLKIS